MGCQVPRGRQGPSGHQVPSLTMHDMFHPDSRHISMSHQVPSDRQVLP